MIFNPYLHPEFGYLGAAPRLRRELRVAVFAGLFGIVIGAATVIAMSSGDRNGNSTTRAGAITTQAGPAPSVASVGNAPPRRVPIWPAAPKRRAARSKLIP